jgi:hypothetical protein
VSRSLAEALKTRYPHLTDSQRELLEAAFLRELAEAVARGEAIAIIRPLADGSFEISRFAVMDANGAGER